MKKLILVRGVSGSGKSTVAEMFENDTTESVEADDYFVNQETGEYNFDASQLGSAHSWCQFVARTKLKNGLSIIVSNTSVSEKDVKVYQEIAEECGAQFFSIVVENRHGNGSVHDVPDAKRESQAKRLRNSIKLI